MPRRMKSPPPDLRTLYGPVPVDDPKELDIVALLPAPRDLEALKEDLYRISRWLDADLGEKEHLDPSSNKRLKSLDKKIGAVMSALDDLGDEASEALHRRAEFQRRYCRGGGEKSAWQWLEPEDAAAVGAERVKWVRRVLHDCQRWAREAHFYGRRPQGRPPHTPSDAAIRALAAVWLEQTGRAPTISTDPVTNERRGPFVEFCSAVILPIYEMHGLEAPQMPEYVHWVLRKVKGEA